MCHVSFSWKKTSKHLKTFPSIHISWRPRRYGYGCLATAKSSPPSSHSCKLIGLCWLLWRYCLWWLPLAILFWAVALIPHALMHGELLWRPWTVFGALCFPLLFVLVLSLQTLISNCQYTTDFVSNWLSWHSFCLVDKYSAAQSNSNNRW